MEADYDKIWETFTSKIDNFFQEGYELPQPIQVQATEKIEQNLCEWKGKLSQDIGLFSNASVTRVQERASEFTAAHVEVKTENKSNEEDDAETEDTSSPKLERNGTPSPGSRKRPRGRPPLKKSQRRSGRTPLKNSPDTQTEADSYDISFPNTPSTPSTSSTVRPRRSMAKKLPDDFVSGTAKKSAKRKAGAEGTPSPKKKFKAAAKEEVSDTETVKTRRQSSITQRNGAKKSGATGITKQNKQGISQPILDAIESELKKLHDEEEEGEDAVKDDKSDIKDLNLDDKGASDPSDGFPEAENIDLNQDSSSGHEVVHIRYFYPPKPNSELETPPDKETAEAANEEESPVKDCDENSRVSPKRKCSSSRKTAILQKLKPFQCTDCKRRFPSDYMLVAHRQIHKAEPLTCDECQKTFSSRGGYISHMRMHSGEDIPKCPDCDYVAGSQAQVNAHYRAKHVRTLSHLCDVCGQGFVTKDRMIRHRQAVHRSPEKSKSISCKECSFATHSEAILRGHVRNKHSNGEGWICNICGARLKYKHSLETHQMRHREKDGEDVPPPRPCKICSYQPSSSKDARLHMAREHPGHKVKELSDEKAKCTQCKKWFRSKSHLTRHIRRVHEKALHRVITEADLFYCEHCSFKTANRYGLKVHMKNVHSETPPQFVCNICGTVLKFKQSLLDHQKRHFNQKNFQCSLCPFLGICEKDVKNHIRRMHLDQNYPCTVCGKTFKQAGHLKRHQVIHTGANDYQCTKCNYRCNVKGNLSKHMEQVHKIKIRLRNYIEKMDAPSSTQVSYVVPKAEEEEDVESVVDEALKAADSLAVAPDSSDATSGAHQYFQVPVVDSETVEEDFQEVMFVQSEDAEAVEGPVVYAITHDEATY